MVVKLTNIGLKRLPDKSFSRILDIKVPLLSLDGKNPSDVVKVKVKLNEIKEKT